MWEAKEVGGEQGVFMTFTNRWTGQMLSSSGTTLTTEAAAPGRTGSEPYIWRAVRTGKNLELLILSNSQGARITSGMLQPVD